MYLLKSMKRFLYEFASKHKLGEYFTGCGLKIFTIDDKDATEEQSRLIFEKWLKLITLFKIGLSLFH